MLREEIQLKSSGHIAFTARLAGPVWCKGPTKHHFRQEVGTAAELHLCPVHFKHLFCHFPITQSLSGLLV